MIEKILILGEKGFIGSNLIYLFRKQGYNVSVLSRLEFSDPKKVLNTFEASDVILNCIGSANVGYSFSNTTDDFDSNVGFVRKAIEILRENNFNHIRFINLSSAAVYGNPTTLPVKETDFTQPLSPYGYHKLMAEWLLKEYSQCFGLKTLSLRIFSAYGNRQKKLLLWDLHEKIQKSKDKIVLFGTGNESRDFIHIEDIAQQISLAITHANFKGEAINVANGIEVKIDEIVRMYQKYYPKDFDYKFNGETRKGDPLRWQADISKMRDWGYTRKIEINNGIKEYIDWIIKND